MSNSYSSKLRDARWQKKRLEIMQRDNWTCRSCGANGEGVTLNVHHAYYITGRSPWEYPEYSLFTYCEDCHTYRRGLEPHYMLAICNLDRFEYASLLRLIEKYPRLFQAFHEYQGILPSDEQLAGLIETGCELFSAGMEAKEAIQGGEA
jgi:hypothetical protein